MIDIFIPYSSNNVFGCDSEGMFVLDEVVEWLWSKDRAITDEPTVRMQKEGGLFSFIDERNAMMFKLRWGGK